MNQHRLLVPAVLLVALGIGIAMAQTEDTTVAATVAVGTTIPTQQDAQCCAWPIYGRGATTIQPSQFTCAEPVTLICQNSGVFDDFLFVAVAGIPYGGQPSSLTLASSGTSFIQQQLTCDGPTHLWYVPGHPYKYNQFVCGYMYKNGTLIFI